MRRGRYQVVIITGLGNVAVLAVQVLHEQARAEVSEAFVNVHLFGAGAGYEIPEPMVRKLVRYQVLVAQCSVRCKIGVADVGGMLHGTRGGKHIADPVPAVWAEPAFKRVERILQCGEGSAHVGGVIGQGRKDHRNSVATHTRECVMQQGIIASGHRD